MVKFKLIDGQGWILRLEGAEKPKECGKCSTELGIDFYYCRDKHLGFCNECEKSFSGNLCNSKKTEHEHYNIIEIDETG